MARGSKRGHDKWSRRHDASDAGVSLPHGDPLADETEVEPFDLAAVQRDDALIDALASGDDVPTATADEYRLASLLAGWRAEIVGQELPAGPTLDEVAAAVDAELARGQVPHRGVVHVLRPVAGAAAAIAVVMAGLTVFSYNAEPGDPLWKVKEVVFTERANSTVATIDTSNNLEEAERMIRSGDLQGAIPMLESASKRVGAVNDSDKRDELNAWHDRLMADATAATSAAPVPSVPVPTAGATTTLPVPGLPETTLSGVPPTTTAQVPMEILTVPTVPAVPPVTPPPVVSTVVPVPPVTVVPTTEPELPLPPDSGSSEPTTTTVAPTSKATTGETRQLVPESSPTTG